MTEQEALPEQAGNVPPWLCEPGIQFLLNTLVDRLEAAEKKGSKPQSLKLDSKSYPALFDAEWEGDKEDYWEHLKEMESWGWFRIQSKKPGPAQGLAAYQLEPRLMAWNELAIRKAVDRPQRIKPYAELWRDAVMEGLQAAMAIKEKVVASKVEVPGYSAAEVVDRLNRLPKLADEPLFLREVSARLFWGMSKVLDKRQPLVAALLDVEECPFPEAPVQLQVYLPPGGFDGVLFIENVTTFERAIRSGAGGYDRLALVNSAGFKGSAQRMRRRDGVSVYPAEHGSRLSEDSARWRAWLHGELTLPCWFWGDLDYEGMQILAALRKGFADLGAWQPGYRPMLEVLLADGGHSPEAAGKELQRDGGDTGCPYADQFLLPAMRKKRQFVDQEII